MTTKTSTANFMRTVQIRQQIDKLRNQHGGVLNVWPDKARQRYERLEKRLRRLEGELYGQGARS